MKITNRFIQRIGSVLAATLVTAIVSSHTYAQDADLAKKLANPIASLISVPFQFNYDEKTGPGDGGKRFFVNVQPVIPISISQDWNMISRTILPITNQTDIVPGSGHQFGLGDTTQSLFFSPKAPGPGGIIWGVGPVFLLPTATDSLLGGQKWGAGPTGVMLKQSGPWTYGVLANHIWSVAGVTTRNNISSTYLQPFLAYTTPTAWTYTLNLESSYDWVADKWSVPVNAQISKVLKLGNQPVSIGGGVRYWLASPDTGPKGWGGRLIVTFLYPTK
jgi:hypothetical protein